MKRIVFCLMALVMWAWAARAQAQEPSVFTVVFATSGDGFLNVRDQPSMKGQSTICLSIVTIMWTKRICYSSRQ